MKNETETIGPIPESNPKSKTGAATDRHSVGVGNLLLRQWRHQRLRGPVFNYFFDLSA